MSPRLKKFFSFTLLASFLLTTGLGCRGLSKEQQAAIKPVTIEYWTVFNDVEQLRKLANAYKVERPYVTVNIRQVRYEEFDKLFVNALADDVQPDIVSMHTRWLRKYTNRLSPMPAKVNVANITVEGQYRKETIVTQQELNMPTPRTIATNFVKTVPADVTVDGDVYGLPLSVDTMGIFYNKDLLDKAGVALPPTTWGELLEVVKKVTKIDADGKIIQSGIPLGTGENIDNAADILALLMMQNGVQVAKGQAITFADGLSQNPETHPAREALRFYTDFARATKEAYTWNETLGNAVDAFVSNRTVFYVGYSYDYDRIKARAPQMNLEVIPLPQLNPSAPVNIANYWIESVVKKSKNQNESWDFIRFLTTPENIQKYTESTRRPTPLRSQIQAQTELPALEPFVQGLLTADNWYRGRENDVANSVMKNLITQYLQPYGENQAPEERDAQLISNAASLVQQTM